MKGVNNMIGMNLASLRKHHRMTQEELAERIGVTRQAIAKWERGESTPDLERCIALAQLFEVTVDDLIRFDTQEHQVPVPPKGRYFFGSVTVGERGQIVIPKRARELFGIAPGDKLLVLGDAEQGLAVLPQKAMEAFFKDVGFFGSNL